MSAEWILSSLVDLFRSNSWHFSVKYNIGPHSVIDFEELPWGQGHVSGGKFLISKHTCDTPHPLLRADNPTAQTVTTQVQIRKVIKGQDLAPDCQSSTSSSTETNMDCSGMLAQTVEWRGCSCTVIKLCRDISSNLQTIEVFHPKNRGNLSENTWDLQQHFIIFKPASFFWFFSVVHPWQSHYDAPCRSFKSIVSGFI